MNRLITDPAPEQPGPRPAAPHDSLSYAVVRSGTSRIAVFRGKELPHDASARESVLLHLLARDLAEPGPGRNHYQSNQVAVLEPGDGENAFAFRFYQAAPWSGRLFASMECANAAPASAVAAGLWGMLAPEAGNCLRVLHLGTEQQIELIRPAGGPNGDWGVRFTRFRHLSSNFIQHGTVFRLEHRGITVTGDIVLHGNVFVMANVARQQVDRELVRKLAALGNDFGARFGHRRVPSTVLVYRVRGLEGPLMECEAACFWDCHLHRSFPGSAAMAMAAFFPVRGFLDLPDQREAEAGLRVFHPSGTLTARSRLQHDGFWEVVSTSFETPVRVLAMCR